MFPLHDRSRRKIALAMFFLLCLVPSAGVVAWGVARRLPSHVRAETEQLGWRLGMKAALAAVRHPRPGVVIYEGLELANPATGRVVLRCRSVEAKQETLSDWEKREREFLSLTVDGAEIEAAGFGELRQLVDRLLACRTGWPEACVAVVAGDVTVRAEQDQQTLTGVRGRIESLSQGTWASLVFSQAGGSKAAKVSVTRDGQTPAPTLHVDLDTGGEPLAGWLLSAGWDGLAVLGPRTQFAGVVQADGSAEAWTGEIRGRFTGVDLDRLVTRRFPHTLTGNGQLTLLHAAIREGRIEQAAGSLVVSDGGTISRSLLEAAALKLNLRLAAVTGADPIVPFQQFGVVFSIESGQLQLRGQCPLGNQYSTAVVLGSNGPLLDSSVARPLPAAALVQTLVPAGPVQVTAAPQTDWLLCRLPVAGPTTTAGPVAEARRATADATQHR